MTDIDVARQRLGPFSSAQAAFARADVLRLSPARLAVGVLALAAADWGTQVAGASAVPGGPLDEVAHALTTLLIFWAVGRRVSQPLLVPALIASVAIDLDHIPDRLGVSWLTSGTPRPYTHSLMTILVLLGAAALSRPRRFVLAGIAAGLAIHFWRDMSEHGSGVSLLWPESYRVFSFPHAYYVLVMFAVVGVDALRCRAGRRTPIPQALV